MAGSISGAGGLSQNGVGTTVLTGANSFTGSTAIAAGTLQVANGGKTGTLGAGSVVNDSKLSHSTAATRRRRRTPSVVAASCSRPESVR